MLPIIPFLTGTQLGRRILLGASAVLVLAVGLGILRQRWIESGKAVGRAEQLEVDKLAWEQDRIAYGDAIRGQAAQLAEARELLIQYQAALIATKAKLDALAIEQENVRDAMARIPDAGLLADIRARLGRENRNSPARRGPTIENGEGPDTRPLTPAELRACDLCLAELPLARQQASALQEMVSALEGKAAALQQENHALGLQRDAALSYANRLETHYVAAYNLAQGVRKRRLIWKILSFGLLKDPKTVLPTPVSLK